jgi:hypothetical protein
MRRTIREVAFLGWLSLLTFACALAPPRVAAAADLATLNLAQDASCWGPVLFHYVPSLTTIINEPIPNELETVIRVAKLRLSSRSDDTLLVDYDAGPSCDPGFIIYRIERGGPRLLAYAIIGLELEAPGDGCFYVRGHADSWFDKRRTFTVDGGDLRELRQPFYYVGLETKTLKQIIVFSSEGFSEETRVVPAGTPITVLLNDGDSFLLKTDHDVLGWWRPRSTSPQKAEEIEGLFLRGD